MSLSQKLKDLRAKKGLSQAALADILGLSQQAIGKWERDKSTPDYETLVKISSYFQVPVDDLLETKFTSGLLGKSESFVPLEDGDAVLQQSPKCRVLVHTTKGLPDEAMDDLIAIAEVYKKKYGIE